MADDPQAELRGPVVGEFAVLRVDAPLWTDGKADAKRLPGVKLSTEPYYASYEVTRVDGDWVELRNVGRDRREEHCQAGSSQLESFDIRVWTLTSHLSPTVRVPSRLEFADGTSIELVPGTPLSQAGRDLEVPWLPNVTLELGPDSVGRSYTPEPTQQPPVAKLVRPFDADGLQLGTTAIAPTRLTSAERESDGTLGYAVFGADRVAGGRLLSMAAPCTSLVLFEPTTAETKLETAAKPMEFGGTIGELRDPSAGESAIEARRVKPGATVYWKSGKQAGHVTRPYFLRLTHGEDRLCEVAGPFCFESKDVETELSPATPHVNGLGL